MDRVHFGVFGSKARNECIPPRVEEHSGMPLTARLARLESHRAFPGWKTRVPRACRIVRAPERRVGLVRCEGTSSSLRLVRCIARREHGRGNWRTLSGEGEGGPVAPFPFIEPVLFHARPPVALVNGFFALARAEQRFAVCVAARCTRERTRTHARTHAVKRGHARGIPRARTRARLDT